MSNRDMNIELQTINKKLDTLMRMNNEAERHRRMTDSYLEEIYKASAFALPILAWRALAERVEKGWVRLRTFIKKLFIPKKKEEVKTEEVKTDAAS